MIAEAFYKVLTKSGRALHLESLQQLHSQDQSAGLWAELLLRCLRSYPACSLAVKTCHWLVT